MKLRPLKNHVIIEEIKKSEELKSGIILPNAAKESSTQGIVVGVGNGLYDERSGKLNKPPFKEGQIVLFPRGTGQKIELEGKHYLFLKPEDIVAIVKQDENG